MFLWWTVWFFLPAESEPGFFFFFWLMSHFLLFSAHVST